MYFTAGYVMLVTILVTSLAGWTIRQWKVSELEPLGYRWNCRDEGVFLLFHFVLLITTSIYIVHVIGFDFTVSAHATTWHIYDTIFR